MTTLLSAPPLTLSAVAREHLVPSPTLHINERVKAMWAAGEEVFHLGFGESRFPVHAKLQAALAENAHRKSYLAGQGLAELREAIARFYTPRLDMPGPAIDPAQVIVGPGSKALIYALLLALDGELFLPTPSWVSYMPQARLAMKAVHHIPAFPAEGYALTVENVARTVAQSNAATKILLINSPNNPTGRMFDPSFLEELANFCRQERIIVLSDEIYALVPHIGRKHLSIAHFYPEGTVVLGGLSKHLSLGGWRLGVGIVPNHAGGRQLMTALYSIASEIWSTPTAPVQYAAVLAYADDPEINAYVDECARIHTLRTEHMWAWLTELGIDCAQPQGGFYLFPNFDRWREPLARQGIHTSDDLARHLLDKYQLAALPGTAFGAPGADLSLRLSTSYLDMESDAQADALLTAYRANPDPAAFMASAHPATAQAIARFRQFIADL